MQSSWPAIVGTIVGAIIGSLSSGIMAWYSIRSNERKHRRDIIIKAALENYKYSEQHASSLRDEAKPSKIPPLDVYIIYMSPLLDEIIDRRLTKDNVVSILQKVNELTDEMQKFYQ